MGMFDNLICKYPLPVDGANDLVYQTKDTDAQFLDDYEIREDGTLWHQEYDIEDKSDKNAEGIFRLAGCLTRINERWEQDFLTREIRFYTNIGEKGWIEFSAYFVKGQLKELNLIEHKT